MIPDINAVTVPKDAVKPELFIDPVANGFIVRERAPEFGARTNGDAHVFTDAKSLGDFITKVYQCFEPEASKFPEAGCADIWHNPFDLTPEQVGVSEGWRLLTKREVEKARGLTVLGISFCHVENPGGWSSLGAWHVVDKFEAYRTQRSLTDFVLPQTN